MFETLTATIVSTLTSLGISPSHLIAGLAGAFVRSVIQGKKLTWELFSTVVVGALCATYLTPVVVLYLGVAATNGLAFGIGLIGMSVAEGVVKLVHKWALNPKLPTEISAKGIAKAFDDDEKTK